MISYSLIIMEFVLPKDHYGCPYLLLAPMEGVGDRSFRRAMVKMGGFDEACIEFLRVPINAYIPSLAIRYCADDTTPIPQAAQLMGSDPMLMAEMTHAVAERGAPRVDLNCGCPSNTVTGRGAGSSLLKDPEHLHRIAKAMVKAVEVPVTAKLRIGFEDTLLFKENILAAQEAGIRFLTLHARTKADGYALPARWEYIAEAKELLKIPVVGNGDIQSVEDAVKMLTLTRCDGLMIGRGGVTNPWIFLEIKAHFAKRPFLREWERLAAFFETFVTEMQSIEVPLKIQINKIKQLFGFMFRANSRLHDLRQTVLTTSYSGPCDMLQKTLPLLKEGWSL